MSNPKQLGRIGIFYLEEAVLDVISQNKGDYVRAVEISKSMGFSTWDNGWIVKRILDKLEEEGRVEARRTKKGSATGWKLTEAEYQKRR